MEWDRGWVSRDQRLEKAVSGLLAPVESIRGFGFRCAAPLQ